MAFYPISQTINQLTVASMKATERTASYARWSFLLSIPELLLTYLLLAPVNAPVPGLHLGAVGMAIKTALYGLVAAQIYDWVNCRFFKIRYAAELTRKLVVALTIGATSVVLVGGGVRWLPRLGVSDVTALSVSSCIYAAAVMLLVMLWPGVAGISREQLMQGLRPFGCHADNPGRVAK
jgi:hypothetical protein